MENFGYTEFQKKDHLLNAFSYLHTEAEQKFAALALQHKYSMTNEHTETEMKAARSTFFNVEKN